MDRCSEESRQHQKLKTVTKKPAFDDTNPASANPMTALIATSTAFPRPRIFQPFGYSFTHPGLTIGTLFVGPFPIFTAFITHVRSILFSGWDNRRTDVVGVAAFAAGTAVVVEAASAVEVATVVAVVAVEASRRTASVLLEESRTTVTFVAAVAVEAFAVAVVAAASRASAAVAADSCRHSRLPQSCCRTPQRHWSLLDTHRRRARAVDPGERVGSCVRTTCVCWTAAAARSCWEGELAVIATRTCAAQRKHEEEREGAQRRCCYFQSSPYFHEQPLRSRPLREDSHWH